MKANEVKECKLKLLLQKWVWDAEGRAQGHSGGGGVWGKLLDKVVAELKPKEEGRLDEEWERRRMF